MFKIQNLKIVLATVKQGWQTLV